MLLFSLTFLHLLILNSNHWLGLALLGLVEEMIPEKKIIDKIFKYLTIIKIFTWLGSTESVLSKLPWLLRLQDLNE